MGKFASVAKNSVITAGILWAAFAASVLLQETLQIPEHVTTTFAFAVFLISMLTQGYAYGIAAAFLGTVAINYAFTFPYFRLNFTIPTNLFSAIAMIVISVLTSTLTTKVKRQEAIKAEGEKERMRANLLRAVSHDLRTPLTAIYGSSTALMENGETLSDQQRQEMLLGIQEESQWLMRMVENLLSITRIDSGRVSITKTVIALDELVDSVLVKFRKRYPGQPLELAIPPEITLIPMDPILIEQVIINLLENAVQHAAGMTKLHFRVTSGDGRAVFEIADDGCGLGEDKLARIFSGTDTEAAPVADGQRRSAGIGLSVCATIIRAHGGEIFAGNLPGGGAVFRFTLDLEEYDHEQQ